MSRKVLLVQELLSKLRDLNGKNGLTIHTSLHKPDGNYRVGVEIAKSGNPVMHYYSSNLNDATGALKSFVALLSL